MASSGQRQEQLGRLFEHKYRQKPDFYARAPGRVNLIGEHIDYHGYSVLPMALTKDIIMAVSRNDSDQISLASTNPERYPDFTGQTSALTIDKHKPLWHHYVLCGIKGCLEALPEGRKLPGMNILVDGEVPANAGLSSSSALVCCAALASFQASRSEISRKDLANLCAQAERYIGTEGGGMDQAISMLAQAGKAKRIDFDPLTATDVTLPSDAVFVVASSGVELNKAATSHFNTRVAEGRVAVAILAHANNLNWRDMKKAKVLQEALKLSGAEMGDLVESTFHDLPYATSEAANLLGVTEKDFKDIFLSHATQNLESFRLKQRLRHIYSESDRVSAFQEICSSGSERPLVALGDLMYKSHVSCRDDYECSGAELDELVEVMMQAGAYGARLTGAGWGGCVVALISKGKEQQFLLEVQENFYLNNSSGKVLFAERSIFVTSPGDGAQVLSDEISVLL